MTLVVIGLAVFRITRLLTTDTILDLPRQFVHARSPWWSQVLDCDWCAGWWVSLLATVALYISGYELPFIVWLALPWALSAVAGIISEHT